MTDDDTCPALVHRKDAPWGERMQRCGRPFRTDEQRDAQMCGSHLAGRKRSDASYARTVERDARTCDLVTRLRSQLGGDLGTTVYAVGDNVQMGSAAAQAILDRLDAEPF